MNKNALPEYYKGIPEIDALTRNIYINYDVFNEILKHYQMEIIASTASNEGLKQFSIMLDTEFNKNKVLAKLSGAKTITKMQLANIIKSIFNIETKVTVNELFSDYVVLIGVHIKSNDLNAIERKVREELKLVIPSHLKLQLYLNVLLWRVYDLLNKSWREWDALNLTWKQFEEYNEGV